MEKGGKFNRKKEEISGVLKPSDFQELSEREKKIIRERIFAKRRLQEKLGAEVSFTPEELKIIEEDRKEDMESRDLSGH